MTEMQRREGKKALISLVVVFILIMTLAGGCVPTAMAGSPFLPSQPAPAANALHDAHDLESTLAAWTGEHPPLPRMAGAAAMCRFLVNNPSYIPDGTEIRFVSFGSEEAGLRGSRRYVARHLDELKRLEARLLNFEMVAHPQIAILASDINGTVKHSSEMVLNVVTAAERAGVPFKVQPAYLGIVTDAGPFSRAGLRATTLLPFKVPQQMVAFYHQKWDSPDVLAIEPLLNVLRLTFEWVRGGGEEGRGMPSTVGGRPTL